MSRDIRSFLITTKKSTDTSKLIKVTKHPVISSDEEEHNDMKVNLGEDVNKVNKTVIKKDKTHVLSDSDDDTIQKKLAAKSLCSENASEMMVKSVSIENIFGKTPIKRINTTSEMKKMQKEEASIHNDDDFKATLHQLDQYEIDKIDCKDIKITQIIEKRKKSRHDENSSHKKLKLNDNEVTENQDVEEQLSGRDIFKKKLDVNNKKKFTESYRSEIKSDIVIEEKNLEKKRKFNNNENVDVIEQHIAIKKKYHEKYQAYLHRGGARNPGSKTIPQGASNCLAGLSFVVTGVLESLERDDADKLIEQYGGRVVKALSKKTDYLVVGDEAGESKLSKAQSFKTKQICEDELLDLIRSRPPGQTGNILHSHSKKKGSSSQPTEKHMPQKISLPKKKLLETIDSYPSQLHNSFEKDGNQSSTKKISKSIEKTIVTPSMPDSNIKLSAIQKLNECMSKNENENNDIYIDNVQSLVEKYRPRTMKQIIGQHGDKSTAKKFYTWMKNWHKNRNSKIKHVKPSPWTKNDDGAFFKACLLSGPPGIGKTTTAQVVCSELGYDLLEFNASDTRSKRLLKEEISGLLSNSTVKGYFSINLESKMSNKHVLLMDEVDGMAGNEDRGGLQELISLIKSTEIPIVCICNDRNNPKMRTLSNYTFDLRFQKPRIEQIRGAMKSLCYNEKITIATENLDQLIQSTNHDIRQIINHLAMLVDNKSNEIVNKPIDNRGNKDLKLGPWDVVRKVFSSEEHKTMSIHDKSDLFFHDYSIAGLFVYENYLTVIPKCPKDELLERISACAESLAMGDLVDHAIRDKGSWSLLPVQAWYSSVIPGTLMSGFMGGQINFPAWLGRNSKRGKFDRLLQEITIHTRLVTGASKEAINIDYLKLLRDAIIRPLVIEGNEGVEAAINVMNYYHLFREDLDSLVEVSLWPGQRDPMQSIDFKVKAAFTRAYNKSVAPTSFFVGAKPKKNGTLESQDSGFIDALDDCGDNNESEEDNSDTLNSDRMVKTKRTAKSKSKVSSSGGSSDEPAIKRGRGRGRGK